mgnify:CR=1 FL=1
MARKKIVAGNWKMNMTPSQAVKLVEELKPLVVSDDVEVVYCVPAIDIVPVVEAVKGTNVAVGAENMYFEEKGAYTEWMKGNSKEETKKENDIILKFNCNNSAIKW